AAVTTYKCVNNACVLDATGTYTTQAACTAACGSSTRGYHFECRSNLCVKITGNSNDTGGCSVEGRGCLYQHKTCVNNACVVKPCSPDSSACAENCVSNSNCSAGGAVITPTPTPAAQKTLPVTGTVENTAVILLGGTLLLFLARTLLAL
ncbi:MAG: hypothetical protein Q7S14_01030, partial [bacterium]|nr:hypothetical protein [bacterium]